MVKSWQFAPASHVFFQFFLTVSELPRIPRTARIAAATNDRSGTDVVEDEHSTSSDSCGGTDESCECAF